MFDHYYGLTANPFQLTPDPRFYFESGTHRKALSYLGYGLAQGEGFIVITGEIGAGKTTLVGHLMTTVDRARLTAANIVTSALGGEDMIHMAAESFGIDTQGKDKASTLKAIENFLQSEARSGRRCLLVVDEAQNLAIEALEELRMLSNFQLGSSSLLQIFLLGQPEFRVRIQSEKRLEQLRQRVIATHHLEAMEANEVEPYIIHRLSKVGWTGRPDITPDSIKRLYKETGGVPRRLNSLLSRFMLMGAIEETDLLDMELLARVLQDQKADFGQSDEAESAMPAEPAFITEPVSIAATPEYAQPAAEYVSESESVMSYDSKAEEAIEPEITSHDQSAAHPAEPIRADMPPMMRMDSFQEAEVEVAPSPLVEPVTEAVSLKAATLASPEELQHLESKLMVAKSEIEALQGRLSEQEVAIRNVLAMLIDWAENDLGKKRSASNNENARAA